MEVGAWWGYSARHDTSGYNEDVEERSIVWKAGQETTRTVTMAELPEMVTGDDLVWYDLSSPSAADVAELGQILDLDCHTVEDALSERERPRIVHFGEYSFLTAYCTHHNRHRIQVKRISVYIFPSALITIHPADTKDMEEVVGRWRQDYHLAAWGVRGLLYALMDVMVDTQFEVLETIDAATDDLSKQLFSDKMDVKHLQRATFIVRGQLVHLHRIVPQTRDIVASIMRQGMADDWPTDLHIYWEDVNNHILRASEWADSLREMVSSLRGLAGDQRLTHERDHEEIGRLGGHHRRADPDHRVVRHERALPRLRETGRPDLRRRPDHRLVSHLVFHLPQAQLALTSPAQPSMR